MHPDEIFQVVESYGMGLGNFLCTFLWTRIYSIHERLCGVNTTRGPIFPVRQTQKTKVMFVLVKVMVFNAHLLG